MATTDPDGPAASPNGLNIHPRPTGITRVNKKVGIVLVCTVAVVVVAIVAGVVTRGSQTAPGRTSGEAVARLEPASLMGEQVTRDIPNGPMARGQIKEDRSRPTTLLPPAGVMELPAEAKRSQQAEDGPPLIPVAGRQPAVLPNVPAPALGGPNLAGNTPTPQAVRDPVLEAQQRLQEEHAARLRKAMEATTAPQGFGSSTASAPPQGTTPQSQATLLQQLQTSPAQARGIAPQGLQTPSLREEDDPNKQGRKEQFLRDMEAIPDRNFVRNTRTAPLSRYEVKAGWLIPATMQHGINSDLPGKISAVVSQDVWDTASGRHLLIPQGAVLFGTYDQQVAYGQNGLLVLWRRLLYPDGSALDLEGMGGVDESGFAGFRDQVDNHYLRLVGFGLMTSLFASAFQISQNEKQGLNNTQTPSQVAGAAVAQQMSQLGIEVTRRNLRVQPTIEVRPGYQFFVRVEKDLVFTRPYIFGNAP